MVAQVVTAPVMMVGQVVTTVVKTASTVAMKVGTATAKAGASVARATGSALRTSAATAGKAGKGLLTSVRSGPLASRFSALSSSRAGAARMASQGAGRAPRGMARAVERAPRGTPVSEAVRRGAVRAAARHRMQMEAMSHPVDARDRRVMNRLSQVDGEQEKQPENPFLEIARMIGDKVRRSMAAARALAMQTPQSKFAMMAAQREHDAKTSPSLQR